MLHVELFGFSIKWTNDDEDEKAITMYLVGCEPGRVGARWKLKDRLSDVGVRATTTSKQTSLSCSHRTQHNDYYCDQRLSVSVRSHL